MTTPKSPKLALSKVTTSQASDRAKAATKRDNLFLSSFNKLFGRKNAPITIEPTQDSEDERNDDVEDQVEMEDQSDIGEQIETDEYIEVEDHFEIDFEDKLEIEGKERNRQTNGMVSETNKIMSDDEFMDLLPANGYFH